MYVRLLFVLLVALNLGAAGWLLFAGARPRALPPATDPGVSELQLVSEAAPGARAQPLAPRSVGTHVPAPIASAPIPSGLPVGSGTARVPTGSAPVLVAAPVSATSRVPRPTASAVPVATSSPAPVSATSGAPSPAVAAFAAPGSAPAMASTDACASLGPFTTEADARAALRTLSPHVARIRYRETQVSRPHGYWVYLPATATREQALDEAHALAAKGVKDYYVVTAGDAPNAVSLGLYNDPVHAQNRVAQVEKLGFSAKVKPRVDVESAYWLEYAVPQSTTLQWREWLSGRKGLAATPIHCF